MDGCIVMGCGLKSFDRKMFAHGERNLTVLAKHFENVSVISRVADECYTFMILCRRTDEGHAADIDVFDGIGVGDIRFGNCLFKGIEVDDDKVNVIPAEIEK